MSLLEDLDELLWSEYINFDKALTPAEWCELTEWCDEQFGKDGWWLEKNVMHLGKEEHATMFILRWL